MKKIKNFIKDSWLFLLIFLLGFIITIYPFISQAYYKFDSKDEIVNFTKESQKIDKEEVDRRIKLAKAYNSTLDSSLIKDPFTEEEKKEGLNEYARMLEIKELIGHVEIPKISEDIPIYAGTSDDVLEKGVGHLEGTSLPVGGEATHTVLTAHRGLVDKKLFRNLDKLTYGDIFYIHNIKETLAYKVDQIKVIEPTNFDDLLISGKGDYATLLTCTPYMINSHRLIVRGERIPYTSAIDDGKATPPGFYPDWLELLLLTLPIILILLYSRFRIYKTSKKLRKQVEYLEEKAKEH